MKNRIKILLLSFLTIQLSCRTEDKIKYCDIDNKYSYKVDSVLRLMTLDEKIGQLNQYTGNAKATGPEVIDYTKHEQLLNGKIGSMLNVIGTQTTRTIQESALKSRLSIPVLFGQDVIHGFRTIFPIPLGEASSFDLDLMERTARAAAIESSAQGIHWTFAPMIDITRDARWGRVMEGSGEDTWFGSKVAVARIKGFQGNDLSQENTILACAKHFAAYGACIAGKDYNTVDISEVTLNEVYLPPFRAASEAGVATFMNSFNDINGIPATAHERLQRKLLKKEWNFNGFVVSDWGSIREMVAHGFAYDLKESAEYAIVAGSDMDMESRAYVTHLKELIEEGAVGEELLDDAVRRILYKKFQLGLFDDPFRYCDEEREKALVLSPQMKQISREAGAKSIVLLKNENNSLPLSNKIKKIAVIGALADSQEDMLGFWAAEGIKEDVVTVIEGLKSRYPDAEILYSEGYDLNSNSPLNNIKAKEYAQKADVIIVTVGERANHSGEAKSKADININAFQQQLVKELKIFGKPLISLVMGGRPLIFNEVRENSDAILFTWWLGTEAGNAIADVLSGDYNPSAKLPMTFPRHVGQVPIYYNFKSTGRPQSRESSYSCCYIDIDFEPAYPFGFGMSYTQFDISEPIIENDNYDFETAVQIDVKVKNTGNVKGKEVVQLYIRDHFASMTRAIKELKGFELVELYPGEERIINFKLTKDDFSFYNSNLEYIAESGVFEIMIGNSSSCYKSKNITMK